MTPTCPPNYSCQFTIVHPHVITHYSRAAWWQHDGGLAIAIVLGIAAICAIVVILWMICTLIGEEGESRRELRRRELDAEAKEKERQHELALAEQVTLQLDAAKGDPELFKIAKELTK